MLVSSSSDESDYNVEHYFKPTVKRSTYSNNDSYLSEESSKSDEEMSDEESGEEILDIKEQIKDDSQCIVKQPVKEKNKQNQEPVRTCNRLILYISNLSSDTTRTMLEAFFGDAGDIKSVRIPKKRLSNFAFVEMKDVEGFKNGLKFDGKELDGKKIKVQQGSKNKKHVSNTSKLQKKKRFQIFEKKKLQNIINKNA